VPTELETSETLDVELAWEPSYAIREARAYLQLQADRLAGDAHGVPIQTEVRVGALAAALRLDPPAPRPSLIVMATHGRRGLGRLLVGSTTADVVRSIDVPVVAVPAGHPCESERAA
jgi:nucleotide-binding universal stress UspA family protein